MFRISIKETHDQRRMVLQGKLIAPWTAEVESAWRHAAEELHGHKLVIDLSDVTVIGPDGEDALLALMRRGARFTGCGVLTKHLLNRLARRCRQATAHVAPDLSESAPANEIEKEKVDRRCLQISNDNNFPQGSNVNQGNDHREEKV